MAKKKHILNLTLCMLLALVALAGCKNNDDDDEYDGPAYIEGMWTVADSGSLGINTGSIIKIASGWTLTAYQYYENQDPQYKETSTSATFASGALSMSDESNGYFTGRSQKYGTWFVLKYELKDINTASISVYYKDSTYSTGWSSRSDAEYYYKNGNGKSVAGTVRLNRVWYTDPTAASE